jgi:type VI secretion system protein ImpF
MPEIKSDQLLVPSILDRLIDYEPEARREAPRSRSQLLRELKRSVRRDLENLLNTRIRCISPPPELIELKQSLVAYGLPDFTGSSLGVTLEGEEFAQAVEKVIRRFECRLKKLNVRFINQSTTSDRSIHFQIDATLQVEPAPEPIQFDSVLRLPSGNFEVKGEQGG